VTGLPQRGQLALRPAAWSGACIRVWQARQITVMGMGGSKKNGSDEPRPLQTPSYGPREQRTLAAAPLRGRDRVLPLVIQGPFRAPGSCCLEASTSCYAAQLVTAADFWPRSWLEYRSPPWLSHSGPVARVRFEST
jgi:hypothetical protein